MAAESIGGEGLVQAHQALAALIEDPEQFDEARDRRFSESPPSYRSRPGTATQPASPVPETDPLTEHITRRDQLYKYWMASTAANQFMTQRREELRRIEQADEFVGVGQGLSDLADDRIRERWIEQGIWDPKWYESNLETWGKLVLNAPMSDALWMHEASLKDENSDTDEGNSSTNFIFGVKERRQRTEEEARLCAERGAERLRQRQLTRPIHQFNYQVSRELERLLEERAKEAPNDSVVQRCPPDISTQAYTIVKDRWVDRRIWVEKWGILPGMTWLHERDFEELALEELGPSPPPRVVSVASSEAVPAGPLLSLFSLPEDLA